MENNLTFGPVSPSLKRKLASVENSGNETGDYASLKRVAVDELHRQGFYPDTTYEQIMANPDLYDNVVNLYLQIASRASGVPMSNEKDLVTKAWLSPEFAAGRNNKSYITDQYKTRLKNYRE